MPAIPVSRLVSELRISPRNIFSWILLMKPSVPLALFASCWLSGCGAPDIPQEVPAPGDGAPVTRAGALEGSSPGAARPGVWDSMRAVAEVGGEKVTTGDVSSYLVSRDPALFEQIVDELVLRRVIEIEARRHGVVCAGAELEQRIQQAVDEEVAGARKLLWTRYRVSLEDYLASTRSNLSAYRTGLADRLRRDTVSKMLFERVVRYWSLTTDWVDVRRIVVKDRELANEILGKLQLGASAAVLAKTHCVCSCREEGGKIPRIYRETADPAIAEKIFSLEQGGISEVVELPEGYTIYVVLEIQRRREIPYAGAESEVLASINELSPDPHERRSWYEAAVRRLGGVLFPQRPIPSERAPAGD